MPAAERLAYLTRTVPEHTPYFGDLLAQEAH